MFQNNPTKVLTGEVRLSYVSVVEPVEQQKGVEDSKKYSVTLLIPKSDTTTMADINASIQAAYESGVTKSWKGARPTMGVIVHDGDKLRPSGVPFGPECAGHWVLTARTKLKPQVVSVSNINAELPPSEIYSGMYGRVTISFYAFDTNGNKGVGCSLGNIMKIRDGEPLAGGSSAANDFDGIGQTVASDFAGVGQGYAPAAPAPAAPAGYMPQGYNAAAVPGTTPVNPITGLPW